MTTQGTSSSSNVTNTVFRALNTVITAIVSLNKCQGLFDRQARMKSVWITFEYIQAKEREFSKSSWAFDLHEAFGVSFRSTTQVEKMRRKMTPVSIQAASGSPLVIGKYSFEVMLERRNLVSLLSDHSPKKLKVTRKSVTRFDCTFTEAKPS